jgi:hypothetical protein
MDEATLPTVVPLHRVVVRDTIDVDVARASAPATTRVSPRRARYETTIPARGLLVDVYG